MYKDIWYKVNKKIDLSIPIFKRENVYLEISRIIKFLEKIDDCNYFFSCGTALGLIREGKLLDWDNDVDIDILEPSQFMVEKIINEMKKLEYSFLRVLKKNNSYIQLVFCKSPYHSIDFCFWYREKKYFINDVPETKFFRRSHPDYIYKKFKKINIRNIFFKVPFDHNSYFEVLYGKDWRIPKRYKLWISNAYDLKFDYKFYNIFLKLLWRFSKVNK